MKRGAGGVLAAAIVLRMATGCVGPNNGADLSTPSPTPSPTSMPMPTPTLSPMSSPTLVSRDEPSSVAEAAGSVGLGPNGEFMLLDPSLRGASDFITPESLPIGSGTFFTSTLRGVPDNPGCYFATMRVGEETKGLDIEGAYRDARSFVAGMMSEAGVEDLGAVFARLDEIPSQSISAYAANIGNGDDFLKFAIPADTRLYPGAIARALVTADASNLLFYPVRFLPEVLETTAIADSRVLWRSDERVVLYSMIVVDTRLVHAFIDQLCMHNAGCTANLSPQDELEYILVNEIITPLIHSLHFKDVENTEQEKFMRYWLTQYGWFDDSGGISLDQQARERVVAMLNKWYADQDVSHEVTEEERQAEMIRIRIEAVSTVMSLEFLKRTAPRSGLLNRVHGQIANTNRAINHVKGRPDSNRYGLMLDELLRQQRSTADFVRYLNGQDVVSGSTSRRLLAMAMPI